MRRLAARAWIVALLLVLAAGCTEPGASATSGGPNVKPFPDSVAQVEPLKQGGVTWTNPEIRDHYLRLVSAIGPANEQRKRDGMPAAERARLAFQTRHDARVTCRAMMSDPREVEDLERRDQAKYGHPDGPTFDELVERNRQKGLTGDAIYEAIVESAQRTSGAANDMVGSKGTAP